MIELYKTYNQAKNVFVKPKLHCYFGLWKNDPCLPVWRRGPIWRLGGSPYDLNAKCYFLKDSVAYKKGEETTKLSNGEPYTYGVYGRSYHQLPGNLYAGMVVWNRNIRKKLRKFGIKRAKAWIYFPIWLSFRIFNRDVTWKTKWTGYDIRYEYPPQFTIVFFGLSLSFWLNPVIKDNETEDYNHYWESLLKYVYGKYKGDLLQTIISCGKWENISKNTSYFQVSKNYIKPEYWEEYDKAIELYNELKDKETDE